MLDPPGTLIRAAGLSVLAGVIAAVFGAAAIYLGSTRLAPRVPPGRVWAEWRSRRMLWGLAVTLAAVAALLTADLIRDAVALRDLYWRTRPAEILWICRTGALCGYLFVLFGLTLVQVLRRRARR